MEHYDNPAVSHEMNVGRVSPVREFVLLGVALALGVAVFVVAVYLAMRWLLPFVPFALEERLARPVASHFEKALQTPQSRCLQSLAEALAAHMELPEDVRIAVRWSGSSVPNAFATLGGHITVNQGLLDVVESENALAMVLAHEIAHVRHRDPLVSAGSAVLVSLGLQALLGGGSDSTVSQTSAALSQLRFSRQQERDADAAALRALRRHYGHTRDADGFFRKMQALPDFAARVPEFLQTHPDTEERIRRIAQSAADAPPDAPLTPLPALLRE